MHLFKKAKIVALATIFACFQFAKADSISIKIENQTININTKNWKQIRDQNNIKQELDYSCGAASVATILKEYYGLENIKESDIISAMGDEVKQASFEDMKNAVKKFGFKAIGYAASYEQLASIKIPVIVFLKNKNQDHFAVLRGIDNNTVLLSDPSLGNVTYSSFQFIDLWNTRADKNAEKLIGKFLAITPINENINTKNTFFSNTPRRQSSSATIPILSR